MYFHPRYLPFALAVSTCENKTTLNTGYNCKRRGFPKCSLDLLCDTFTAGLLTVYTGGKQLGIGVSCLCVNRCSINHAGPANKASPSWGSTLHPPARKGVGCRPAERIDTLTVKATVLPILPSLEPQQQGSPRSSWKHLEPENISYNKGWTIQCSFGGKTFMKADFMAIACYRTGHWHLQWALEEAS